jgi:hypothetical protein
MEREDPWCETADLGKHGYTIGVLTNDNATKPTCVCVCTHLKAFRAKSNLRLTLPLTLSRLDSGDCLDVDQVAENHAYLYFPDNLHAYS